jgi:hypothetical protein
MKTIVMEKPPYDGLLKARCESDLEQAYKIAAIQRGVDMADLVRSGLREYAARALQPQSREFKPHGV